MVMRCCISAGYLHRLLATGAKLVLYGLYICLILEKGTLQQKRVCNKCVSFLWLQY